MLIDPKDPQAATGRGLLIVDVQRDFCEGGSLAVAGGADVAARITEYLDEHADDYTIVVVTRDWHEDPGAHFSNAPDYHDSWPPHCVAGSVGAQFHPNLELTAVTAVVSKGRRSAAYSGFEGDDAGEDLGSILRKAQVDQLDICGLTTDYCVRETALDAIRRGFDVRVLLPLCAGVAPESSAVAVAGLEAVGVEIAAIPSTNRHPYLGAPGGVLSARAASSGGGRQVQVEHRAAAGPGGVDVVVDAAGNVRVGVTTNRSVTTDQLDRPRAPTLSAAPAVTFSSSARLDASSSA